MLLTCVILQPVQSVSLQGWKKQAKVDCSIINNMSTHNWFESYYYEGFVHSHIFWVM